MARKKPAQSSGTLGPEGENFNDGKVDVTLDLGQETIARFKALGDDWRKRMSDILEKAEL